MAMKVTSPEPPSVDIDMTPMIDIVFQLITFFMVVINFEAGETDERVKMATSALARPLKVKPVEELVLQLGYIRNKSGKILRGPYLFYNGAEYTIDKFQPMLKREKQQYRLKYPDGPIKSTIVIRADAEAPTGKVQELIKLCQTEGYEKFSLKAMQPEPE
jgi:biopolymer transport protein ExbD